MLQDQQTLQAQDYSTMPQQSGPFLTSTLPSRVGAECRLQMDADLKRVMEFMQSNVAASKLVSLAQALAAVAPVLWGQYEREDVRALALLHPAIGCASTLQSVAT